jgi:hypothetical protein
MSDSLWCKYSDGINLILNGYNSVPRSPDQQKIFMNMLGIHTKDAANESNVAARDLPDVKTVRHCLFAGQTEDEEADNADETEDTSVYETLYYIPDLCRYMFSMLDEWEIDYPPLNLEYLQRLKHGFGEDFDVHIDSSDNLTSLKTDESEERWRALCKMIEIKQKLADLNKTRHEGDPLKMEAQERLSATLHNELSGLIDEYQKTETPSDRKKRLHSWLQDESKLGGETSALNRTAAREGIARQTLSSILKREK